jgi:hypothetical protein
VVAENWKNLNLHETIKIYTVAAKNYIFSGAMIATHKPIFIAPFTGMSKYGCYSQHQNMGARMGLASINFLASVSCVGTHARARTRASERILNRIVILS